MLRGATPSSCQQAGVNSVQKEPPLGSGLDEKVLEIEKEVDLVYQPLRGAQDNSQVRTIGLDSHLGPCISSQFMENVCRNYGS
jgi:hypothetical protein